MVTVSTYDSDGIFMVSIPDSQSFVNLKSNTMKNTLQRYGLSAYLQIFRLKQRIL